MTPASRPAAAGAPGATWSRFGAWRDQRLARLAALAGWLEHSLLDPALWQPALQELQQRLQHDEVQLAFVAEFSRGKSELLNALLFGHLGRRVLPAGAGRTTMCPLEIACAGAGGSRLRLLPIATRSQSRLLSDWKALPQQWQEYRVDAADAAALSEALQHLCDTTRVTPQAARELGFEPDDAQAPSSDGLVEIPRWRHALLDIEHPLLAQGIRMLDTPGLNALGAEPELTLSLIPSAAAVVFLLSADTGVTRSDLQLWNEHVGAAGRERSFVVLNKIDMLWDPLRSTAEVASQIHGQCESVARQLQVPLAKVFPISAHKGLLARIQGDEALLQRSGLQQLEAALGACADDERREWLEGSWRAALLAVRQRVQADVDVRVRQFDEQRLELQALRGKSRQAVAAMLKRADAEREELDAALALVQAVQTVNQRQMTQLAERLDIAGALQRLERLREQLRGALLKSGLRDALAAACDAMAYGMVQAEAALVENQSMLAAACQRLNREFAFSLTPPRLLRLDGAGLELAALRADYLRFTGAAHWLRAQSHAYVERVLLSAQQRLRAVHERAQTDAQHWNRAAIASLQSQARERGRSLQRRLANLRQAAQADHELARRIDELRERASQLQELQRQLAARFELALPEAGLLAAA